VFGFCFEAKNEKMKLGWLVLWHAKSFCRLKKEGKRLEKLGGFLEAKTRVLS